MKREKIELDAAVNSVNDELSYMYNIFRDVSIKKYFIYIFNGKHPLS